MNKYVFLINGLQRSGKDTFANYCVDYNKKKGKNISSIDIAVKAAMLAGYDYANDTIKNDKDRKLLSDIKVLFDEYNMTSLNYLFDEVNKLEHGQVLFYHVRELANIDAIKEHYKLDPDVECYSLLVKKPNVTKPANNMADRDAAKPYEYDFTINNDGSLVDLHDKAEMFIDRIIKDDSVPKIKFSLGNRKLIDGVEYYCHGDRLYPKNVFDNAIKEFFEKNGGIIELDHNKLIIELDHNGVY